MSLTLPIVGILIAVVAAVLSFRGTTPKPKSIPLIQDAAVVKLLIIACIVATFCFAPEIDRIPGAIALILGGAATLLGSRAAATSGAKVAWGAALGSCVHLISAGDPDAVAAAMLIGAGLGSAVGGCSLTAIVLSGVVLADVIGRLGSSHAMMPFAGSVVGLALALSALVTQVDAKNKVLRYIAAVGLPLLFGFLIPGVWLQDNGLASALLLGIGSGVVLNLLIPAEEDATAMVVGIGSVIAVALATLAFALAQGTGMAFALLGAIGVLGILDNRKALLPLGPLAGLVMFRVFRTIYPDSARAFDIGQHYALIGLLFGSILPLLLVDWDQKRQAGFRFGVAALLWGILLAAASPALIAFLGAYGTVGVLIGLGLAGVLECVRKGQSTKVLGTSLGMGGVVLLAYGWMTNALNLTRADKTQLLIWSAVGFGILIVGIIAGSRPVGKQAEEVK